jgi:hypothetical protein
VQIATLDQPHIHVETAPDPNCSPGAISPKVTPDTLDTTVCKAGYTKSIRPPASITAAEKRANAALYGYSGPMSDTEYDHLGTTGFRVIAWSRSPATTATQHRAAPRSPRRRPGSRLMATVNEGGI